MVEHDADLVFAYTWEPIYEIGDVRTVLEIFEKRRYGDSGATKYPSSAHSAGTSFYGFTGIPIDHVDSLLPDIPRHLTVK
jgi:hypothetical protein